MMKPTVSVKGKQIFVNGEKIPMIRRRSGGYRLIGVWKGMIIKCDFIYDKHYADDWCNIQTKNEIKFYNKILPQDKEFFPMLIDCGTYIHKKQTFHWLIQEKIEIDEKATLTYKNKKIMRTIIRRYKIGDIDNVFTGETPDQYSNFAITTKDNIVFYDFGIHG